MKLTSSPYLAVLRYEYHSLWYQRYQTMKKWAVGVLVATLILYLFSGFVALLLLAMLVMAVHVLLEGAAVKCREKLKQAVRDCRRLQAYVTRRTAR